MWKATKPVVGPVVLLAAEYLAIRKGWLQDDLFVGIFFGLGIFWLACAVLYNKALIKRMPRIREWLPFLDPSGGLATEAELRSRVVEGKAFRIAMLAENNRIDDRTFHNCIIYGPAVIASSGFTDAKHCIYTVPAEQFYVMMPEHKKALAGFLVAHDCEFKTCRFIGVSFVGDKHAIEKMKKLPGPQATSGD